MEKFSRNPIKNKTAKIIMFGFALLVLLSALTLGGINLRGFEIPLRIIGIILVFAVMVNFVEIGVKRFTPLSDLKRISASQKASLVIGSVVLVVAIFFLFNVAPPFLINFAPGLLFLEFLVILFEVYF